MNFRAFLELLRKSKQNLRASEKSHGAAEKNIEKVEANCIGFSVEFFWFSVRNVLFCQENKNSIVDNFFTIHQYVLKSLGLYNQVPLSCAFCFLEKYSLHCIAPTKNAPLIVNLLHCERCRGVHRSTTVIVHSAAW